MMSSDVLRQLQKNLAEIDDRIHSACERSNHAADDVCLVAVTKYADWHWVECLAELYDHFGENRPQQLADRRGLLPEINWHLIGQLQRNKVRTVLENACLIHSVDSLKLMSRIADVANQMNVRAQVLLQCNVSGEESKSGFSEEAILAAASEGLFARESVQIQGLMTMAPARAPEFEIRRVFSGLRVLKDKLAETLQMPLPQLSMGMSGDFEIAVEEGATLVRVGSRLFDGLNS